MNCTKALNLAAILVFSCIAGLSFAVQADNGSIDTLSDAGGNPVPLKMNVGGTPVMQLTRGNAALSGNLMASGLLTTGVTFISGTACPQEGALGYDGQNHVVVFCSQKGIWTPENALFPPNSTAAAGNCSAYTDTVGNVLMLNKCAGAGGQCGKKTATYVPTRILLNNAVTVTGQNYSDTTVEVCMVDGKGVSDTSFETVLVFPGYVSQIGSAVSSNWQ